MQKNIIYQGKLSEYQTTPKVRQEQIIFEGLNSNQTELYRRAMYGLKIYPQEMVRAMTNLQRRKITKKCKRAQSVLNLWKQEICNSMANKLIAKHFKMTPVVETFINLHANYVDVEYVNNLSFKDLGIIIKPMFVQTETTWDKSSSNTNTHKNWALLRCVEGAQRTNWGSNGTASQTGTIKVDAEGRNVDVVIVDGMINPAHPEYAVNSDGTGGSRVIQYNWFQHNLGSGTGTYVYTPYTGTGAEADNNHGAHVAGTACGNTQGWARRANIYNLNPYSTDPNGVSGELIFDYLRAFHNNKPINPATGRKNPTIANNSWGSLFQLDITNITNIFYRGAYVGGAPYTAATLLNYGIYASGQYAYPLARSTALEADATDAMNDGIIMVGAASNFYAKIDLPTGQDYNNLFVWTSGGINYGVYYHR